MRRRSGDTIKNISWSIKLLVYDKKSNFQRVSKGASKNFAIYAKYEVFGAEKEGKRLFQLEIKIK